MPTNSPIHFFFESKINIRDKERLKRFLVKIFRAEKIPLESLNYIFCTDRQLLKVNKHYLKHNDYTDIITFDLSARNQHKLAEIYISTDRVKENSKKFKSSLQTELIRVMIHGILHLCGYGDKTTRELQLMRSLEDKYLAKFRST